VITPWGNSDSLRERRLRPIRGRSREKVTQNQRERLYAATVAVVSTKGFAAGTLGEILSASGISSSSFYSLFPDKTACVAATVKAILERCADSLEPPPKDENLASRLRAYYLRLADAVIAQPAAARFCLIDSFAAGRTARLPLDRAQAEVAANLRRLYHAEPGLADLPDEILSARVGAVLELVTSRLCSGTVEELPKLADDVVTVLVADRPAPSIRTPPRSSEPATEDLAAADPVERAVRAFATLVREQGYAETKVDDVLARAGMSSRTFYIHFSGKEDLLAAAIDSACALAVAAVMPAFSRAEDWPDAVRAGFWALFLFLSSRPDLTYLVAVEANAGGVEALKRRDEGLATLGALLVNNTTEWTSVPPVIFEIIAATNRSLVFDLVGRDGASALPALAPICTYLTLVPFVGADVAGKIASSGPAIRPGPSSGVGRRASGSGVFAFNETIRTSLWRALNVVLLERDATAAEIAAEVEEPEKVALAFLRELIAAGALETVEIDGEVRYRRSHIPHKMFLTSARQDAAMGLEGRRQYVNHYWGLMVADVEASMATEALYDPGRSIIRTPLSLDRKGWRELSDLHDRMLVALFELSARNQDRLRASGEAPIEARSLQLAFEMKPRGQS
jgi:AcrR family transcriptional regulator